MSRKYKFLDPEGMYFVSFAVIKWIDVFTREMYCTILVDHLKHSHQHRGMKIYAWCIMPNHVHLVFQAENGNPSDLMRDLKRNSSKDIQRAIESNPKESRRLWLLRMMEEAGSNNSNVRFRQFWQQNNHPIELWSDPIIDQKINYIHMNPVVAGYVSEPEHWRYSSACLPGLIELDEI